MSHLHDGMDSRIGPAGAGYSDRLVEDYSQFLLNYTLNGRIIFLDLPPFVVGTIIGNGESDGFHHPYPKVDFSAPV